MTRTQALVPSKIPFQSATLLLVDFADEPFVPMRPVVEGIGLNWKSQHAKLTSGRFASTMVEITMVAADGRHRAMSCLPLRKLPGWLMTLHPAKVRPEIRSKVTAYQQECDDVLWMHWVNQRGRHCAQESEEPSLQKESANFTADYLADCRRAIREIGGTPPAWSLATEQKVASGMALMLLRNKRWLVTFGQSGDPHLQVVPHDAGIFTPERMLSWIRETDGAYQSFMPELLSAIGDRLRATENR